MWTKENKNLWYITLVVLVIAFVLAFATMFLIPRDRKPVEAVDCPAPPAVDSSFKPMTNDEIISETRKCELAGLIATSHNVVEYGSQTVLIICQPKP